MKTATALLCAALTSPAAADVITWGPVQDVTDASEVSTNGTLVTARNCWAQTFVSPTVNGVAFTAFAPTGWNNGGWSLNAGSTTGDADYDALLDSARVTSFGAGNSNPTGTGAIRLDTLANLDVGTTYEIQVWYSDQRTGTATNILFDREMTLSSAAGVAGDVQGGEIQNLAQLTQGPDSGLLNADPNDMNGAGDPVVGSYCIGTFTRTSTDELYLLVTGSHAVPTSLLRPHINAFQIREVSGTLGTVYCSSLPNSTGQGSSISATGSIVASDNDLTLGAAGIPAMQFGIFLTSMTQASTPVASGTLCLGGNIIRFQSPGQILQADANGEFSLQIDTTSLPAGVPTPILAGDTYSFTAWFRDIDPMIGNTANFSSGLEVTFQ